MDGTQSKSTIKTAIRWGLVIVGILGVVCVGIASYTFANMVVSDSPVSTESASKEYEVIISEDAGVKEVTTLLRQYGLIKNELIFRIQFEMSGKKNKIVPGTYKVNTAMAPSKIIDTLCNIKE